jgi:hypothetical protein
MNYYYLTVGFCIVLSSIGTFLVIKSDDFDQTQKTLQVVLIWLLPLVDAISMMLIYKSLNESNKSHKSFGGGASASSDVSAAGGD